MDLINDRQVGLLEKIGRIFTGNSGDINILMSNVFQLVVSYYNIDRGMINIHHKEEGGIFIDIYHGFSDQDVLKGIYKLDEGVIGTVIKTGNPYIVMDINNEPKFHDSNNAFRNTSANKTSFICVPIRLNSVVIGTISVELINNYGRDLAEEYHTLVTVSIMIAQAINNRFGTLAREKMLKWTGTLEERIDMFEKDLITDCLKISNGNITAASIRLGTTKRILGYKIDKLGIDYKSFRKIKN